MKVKLLLKWFMAIAALFALHYNIEAQGMLREVPLERQVDKSSLVVEGLVVAKKSVWNAEQNRILTLNTVEVYKVFKGKTNLKIEVVTPGGTVGSITQTVTPSLSLNEGEIGVFTLYDNNMVLSERANSSFKKYKTYSSLQGFYKYDLLDNSATNPFAKSKNISNGLHNRITKITGQPYKELVRFDVKVESEKLKNLSSKALAPVIIGFSPASVSAGNGDSLTIVGTGFGDEQGMVEFKNADDGGDTYIAALDSQVLSWTDEEIVVEVPSKAGTGSIRITDSNDASVVSTGDDLFISYALTNRVNSGSAFLIQHIGVNGTGVTWDFNIDFDSNTQAKEAFLRAFDTWRCETGINWVIGTTTSINQGVVDGTNVILFDDADPLDEGVLGQCITTSGSCGDTRDVVTELDIVFSNDIDDPETGLEESWYFGTGLPAFEQYDFESVALHELGHGHQLAHVIETNDVMHYAISNSESQRFLSGNNATAAGIIQNFSTTTQMCGQTMMTDYSGAGCSLRVQGEVLANEVRVYPNPVENILYIKNGASANMDEAILCDVSGRVILRVDLTNASRTKRIDLSHISKGVYLMNIFLGNAKIEKKVVVE
ncbi:T9SS type A sorting domain-containing protein [Flavisericum labens]|uniref:T9SS type A sorting domain-containing protein n=1 Tax=Flavisericum labens TaxID=3377112 RepID=UPI00387ADD49